MISSWLLLSRLPVGSSASNKHGSLARDRAIATRWRWPTESRPGRVIATVAKADIVDEPGGALDALARRPGSFKHGDLHVFERGQGGQQVKRLKDKAHLMSPELVDAEI